MPRINFITSKDVSFSLVGELQNAWHFLFPLVDPLDLSILKNHQQCSFPRQLGCPQDEFRNQLLTAVLFAEQLPLCELPPEPEIEDLSATQLYHLGRFEGIFFLGRKTKNLFF